MARRRFERVLLLRGADFTAYVHLGRIAFDLGDYPGWRREFEHARRTDPIKFARLRHARDLFEPRLCGTGFDADLGGDNVFDSADQRATWRSPGRGDPDRRLAPGSFGHDTFGHDTFGHDTFGHDGFGHGTDLPLAPGYDPAASGQQLDDPDLFADDALERAPSTPTPQPQTPLPDASLYRDDFGSPAERRRFQLRRPIDRVEIARCDLDELLRKLCS